ncbi:MAG TPA: hypothetical protein VHA75_20455 [Rugosimonospora sp.]|nr:hypothetical protein [Rugosimonospora sp.]
MSGFAPIRAQSEYACGASKDFDQHYDQDDHAELRALLLGRKVTKAASDHLLLDDGTVLKLFGNDGGCACSAGCYDLTELNGTDNVITSVEFEDNPGGDDVPWSVRESRGYDGVYRIFVLAGDRRINLATFEGSDGNGYYGTGYHVLIRRAGGSR